MLQFPATFSMYVPTEPVKNFIAAKNELNHLGVSLSILPGEFLVNYIKGRQETAFYSDDLAEAVEMGRIMADMKRDAPAPLGPMGRPNTRRGMMVRHNRFLAEIRRSLGLPVGEQPTRPTGPPSQGGV